MSPLLREALAATTPGEDFDEALLRTLKARYPEMATALLSACTRLIEMEAKRAQEEKQQTLGRLAESDPGPEIALRVSQGEAPKTVTETRVYRIGGKEYYSLDDVPAHLRPLIERAQGRIGERRRVGCAWALLGGWVLALLRALWR